jgi:hypothetical protein
MLHMGAIKEVKSNDHKAQSKENSIKNSVPPSKTSNKETKSRDPEVMAEPEQEEEEDDGYFYTGRPDRPTNQSMV